MEDSPRKDGRLALCLLNSTLGEMHEHHDPLTNDKSTWQMIAYGWEHLGFAQLIR